jgi:hypothetical protein
MEDKQAVGSSFLAGGSNKITACAAGRDELAALSALAKATQ